MNPFPDCEQCGYCCTFLSLPLLHRPDDKLLHWLETRGLQPRVLKNGTSHPEGIVYIRVEQSCPHLSPGGWCTIYDKRPRVCEEGKCVKNTWHDSRGD